MQERYPLLYPSKGREPQEIIIAEKTKTSGELLCSLGNQLVTNCLELVCKVELEVIEVIVSQIIDITAS